MCFVVWLYILAYHTGIHVVSCAGSVVLTQTHPTAPYVCRTGNITLRCQYDGVENVLVVLWIIGSQTTTNPSTIPGPIQPAAELPTATGPIVCRLTYAFACGY